jgi:hypothetical protein
MSETIEKVEKRGRVRIDDVQFVDVWLKHYKAGGTLHDVAAELGCSYGGAAQKAKVLQEDDGVELPELTNRRRKVDAAALNDRIKKALAK